MDPWTVDGLSGNNLNQGSHPAALPPAPLPLTPCRRDLAGSGPGEPTQPLATARAEETMRSSSDRRVSV